jgi:hypothetical protein
MNGPTWLSKYYSADEMAFLNPKVVFEGKNKAVVQLRRSRSSGGTVQVGYVMVLKKGRNRATPSTPLWEGEADPVRMALLRKTLQDSDGDTFRGSL